MNVPDAFWFGILLTAETIMIPYYEAKYVYERACKQYKHYKK